MWRLATNLLLICLSGYCLGSPVGFKSNTPSVQQRKEAAPLAETEVAADVDPNEMMIMSSLSLPSNATSIRADISDGFSCENKTYGYYADVDNDCQIFHVCLPVTYANGKENTFRWSFICPEETIFSQDSFTCMRPDDMTITCEESYQYYELNRNFGMADAMADKEDNHEATHATAETAENENETILEAVYEPLPAKPVVEKEENKIVEQSKPVNVHKPTRRKPIALYATQKKPANSYHLRKVPQAHFQTPASELPAGQVSEDLNKNIKPAEEEKVKPIIKNIFRRPFPVSSNSFKDEIKNSKPESVLVATRTDLLNQMGKRPIVMNKKPVQLLEKQTKIESPQQKFSSMGADMPISSSETQMADSEVEASETDHAFVKLEEPNKIMQTIENTYTPEEPVKFLEAFEEIPADSEFVGTPNSAEVETKEEHLAVIKMEEAEKSNLANEPQTTREGQHVEIQDIKIAEEISVAKDPLDIEKTQAADETEITPETQAAEETIEVQPQPFLKTSAEQTDQPADESKETQAAEKTEIREEPKVIETVALAEIENVQEPQVIKGIRVPEEPQILEETASGEELQTAKAAEETSSIADIKTGAEIQTTEENPLEVQQSLRTSAEEMQNSEKIHITDELAEESPTPEKSEVVEIPQSVGESQEMQTIEKYKENDNNPAEAIVYTPAEITFAVEEPQPIVHNVEAEISAKAVSDDNSKSLEENLESEKFPGAKSEYIGQPTIFEENSEESLNMIPENTIEQMESEKPAEAPESMQATVEMSDPDPIVQQMYEDIDMKKKPVDPAMAHEAEQLIADFINTLRSNDFTNETPGIYKQPHVEAPKHEQPHEDASELQEPNVESDEKSHDEEEGNKDEAEDDGGGEAEIIEIKADTIETNGAEMHEDEETKQQSDEVAEDNNESNKFNSLESSESQKFAEDSAEAMKLPQEMYQNPVQVLAIPTEQLPMKEEQSSQKSEMEPFQVTANTEELMKEESSAMSKDVYKPLSIDDIVELVKERLNHMPKNEMDAPMQLDQVLDEAAQKGKTAEKKMEMQSPVPISNSEEEIVMPIYQRTVQPVTVEEGQQTEDLKEVLSEEPSELANDAAEKTNRSYRSRSMLTPKLDPRKRRFLFKTDLS